MTESNPVALPGGDATPLDREAYIRLRYLLKTRGGWVPRQDIGFLLAQLTLARQQVTDHLVLPHRTLAEMRHQYDAMNTAISDAEQAADEAGFPEGKYLAGVIRELRAQVTALQQERGVLRWEQRKSDAWIREMTEERNTFRARAEAAEQQVTALRDGKVHS